MRDPANRRVRSAAGTDPAGWQWPEEFRGVWRGYPKYVDYVGSGGTSGQDWWLPANAVPSWLWAPGGTCPVGRQQIELTAGTATVSSRYFAGPVAADLNGDGWTEVIIGNLLANQVEVTNVLGWPATGWPRPVSGGVKGGAAPTSTAMGSRKCWWGQRTGLYMRGMATADRSRLAGHAARRFPDLCYARCGDLDGDGGLDVIVPVNDGKLYAIDAAGAIKHGWPVSMGDIVDLYAGS